MVVMDEETILFAAQICTKMCTLNYLDYMHYTVEFPQILGKCIFDSILLS